MEARKDTSTDVTGIVTITASRMIIFLIALITAVVSIQTFIYAEIVDARIERLGLVYASKTETVPRTEYEIRRAEALDDLKRTNDRVNALERRVDDQSRRLDLPSNHPAR